MGLKIQINIKYIKIKILKLMNKKSKVIKQI